LHTKAKHPGRVLVMDDEKSVQLLLDRVLTGAGHSVSIVDSGEAALTELSERPYDLVIADKNLPGVDGLEVLRQARTRHPRLQAVVITGFPTPESKHQAESMGVHAFVTKPFGILEFLQICDAALERCAAT
jgi:CheY-like chemotaxis protein